MGEAKRRRKQDPNFGKPKEYMSLLEISSAKNLVTNKELKGLIKCLKKVVSTNECYAAIVKDNTGRWRKVEKLCRFIGMEKILENNPKLYGTNSIFITKSYSDHDRKRLIRYYTDANLKGYSYSPPPMTKKIAKESLEYSQNDYQELLEADDVEQIYSSDNCTAFYVPSDEPTLQGLSFISFFVKQQLIK